MSYSCCDQLNQSLFRTCIEILWASPPHPSHSYPNTWDMSNLLLSLSCSCFIAIGYVITLVGLLHAVFGSCWLFSFIGFDDAHVRWVCFFGKVVYVVLGLVLWSRSLVQGLVRPMTGKFFHLSRSSGGSTWFTREIKVPLFTYLNHVHLHCGL